MVRRYTDFDRIRSLLVIRWPGCYIPPLPPKSVTKNSDSKFIEERRKQLQSFCKKISDLPFLHYSGNKWVSKIMSIDNWLEEYQIFIRSGNTDLEKTFAPMQKVGPEEIIMRYTTTFSTLSGVNENNLRKFSS